VLLPIKITLTANLNDENFKHLLGAFAKLRIATISFVKSVVRVSVCESVRSSSVRMEHPGSHWTKFHEI